MPYTATTVGAQHPLVIEHHGTSQGSIRKSSNEMGQIPLQILKLPEGNPTITITLW